MYGIFNHSLNTNILYPIRQCKNVLINVTKMFVLQKASSKKIYEYELRTPNGGRSDGPHTTQCGEGDGHKQDISERKNAARVPHRIA